MRLHLSGFFLFFVSLNLSGQSQDSTIVTGRYFLSTTYTFQEKQLTLQGVSEVVKNNPEAYSLLREARGYKTMGNLFGITGGLALGYTVVSIFILKQEANNSAALLGVGGVVLSIPFNLAAGDKARKGVKIYNNELKTSQSHTSALNLRLGYSGNGIKLVLNF